jgi:hypothetical protein
MWKLWLTLAAFVALPFGMMGVHNVYEHHLEKRDMEYVESMKLEPWAVGRYLIDVPRGAEVHYAQGYRGAGADVEVFPCTLSQARGLVQDRVEELRGTEHLLGGTLLEKYVESRTLPDTWILYRWESRTFKSDDLQAFMDAYHWTEQTGLRSSSKGKSYLFKFGRGTNINETAMRQDQAEIEDMFRLVRIRDNREIPTEPGFCMGYSFIPGEAPEGIHGEGASITFTVPGHPDISVRYENQMVSPTTAAGQKLLGRMKDVDSDPMFTALTINTLRAKERSVGPLHGQEYLKRIKEKGVWNMQFLWEFNGVGESWEKPAMSLELINSREKGSRAPLSMTKEEALALWDAMVNSIRLRPTTKVPSGPEAAAAAGLGTGHGAVVADARRFSPGADR